MLQLRSTGFLPSGEKIPAQTIHDVHLTSLSGEFATILSTQELLKKV
jgi:hypothetical protein